jgi:DNA-binding protein YbaB
MDVSVTVHCMLKINSIQIKPEVNVKKDVEEFKSKMFKFHD